MPAAPGGLIATAHGINNGGTIVGAAFSADGSSSQGFLLNGSTYAFFSHPGKTHTFARSINDAGVVTGYAEDEDASGSTISGTNLGFIYDPATGVFTDVVVPGSAVTIAQGINTAGQVVGSARISGRTWGFLRNPDGSLNLFQIDNHYTAVRGSTTTGWLRASTTMPSRTTWSPLSPTPAGGNCCTRMTLTKPMAKRSTTAGRSAGCSAT